MVLAALIFPAILGGADEIGEHPPAVLLEWPMLPGESLARLASLIYPHDRAMQRHFIAAAVRENSSVFPMHGVRQPFERETPIRLPDLRQLSRLAAPAKTSRNIVRPTPAMRPAAAGAALSRLRMSVALEAAKTETSVLPVAGQPRLGEGRRAQSALSPSPAQLQELIARNLDLQAAQSALDGRLAALETDIRQLGEALMRPAAASALPAASPTPIPARHDNPLPMAPAHLLTLAAGALAAGWLLWLRRRKSLRVLQAVDALTPLSSPTAEAGSASATGWSSRQPADNAVDENSISVDEITSIVEEAKIFVALGRDEHAAGILQDYIATYPRASVNPWLYLMDILRAANRKEEFSALAQRFHQTFNLIAPQWEAAAPAMMVVARSLEEFPHILARLTAGWGAAEAQAFLVHLLQDNRGGERTGFGKDVLEEILLLQGVLELRDQLPLLRPF
jgi:hypothetical protein